MRVDGQMPAASRAEARRAMVDAAPATSLDRVSDVTVPGTAGPIPVRVYRPTHEDGLPVAVYLHGGGWVVGDLDTHDATCRDLAALGGFAVVAVHYRRAPEHQFPAALEDALAVTRALLDGSAGLGFDATRVAVCGDSAGANLATVAARELALHEPAPVHQALVYPVCDARVGDTRSYRRYGEGHFLTTRDMRYFVTAYAGGADLDDPRLSPLRAADLSRSPSATVVLAELDPLHDEGVAYAQRLSQAKVPVALRTFPGQVHPFVALPGRASATARRWLAARLAEALA